MPIVDVSGVDSDALNIVNMLDGILDKVVSTFQSYSVPLPTKRYWSVGQAAIDCEQLVVTLVQAYLGPPGDQQSRPQRCNVARSAVILVTLAREIPVMSVNGRPPSPEKITDGAKITAVDSWVLLQSMNLFDQWEGEYGYGVGVIGSVEIPPPEGGFQMVTLQLTMAIP
jgi:hypothetical protein